MFKTHMRLHIRVHFSIFVSQYFSIFVVTIKNNPGQDVLVIFTPVVNWPNVDMFQGNNYEM